MTRDVLVNLEARAMHRMARAQELAESANECLRKAHERRAQRGQELRDAQDVWRAYRSELDAFDAQKEAT
jgi:hypothetical protein